MDLTSCINYSAVYKILVSDAFSKATDYGNIAQQITDINNCLETAG